MTEYSLKLKSLRENVKVELDLSNYAAETDLKYATGIGASKCAIKVNLASLKLEFYKVDTNKLEKVPIVLNIYVK